MRTSLRTSALVALLLSGPVVAVASETETVVIQRNAESAPPVREPVGSINREVKERAERQVAASQGAGEKAVEHVRAPVYRTLSEAAADGVGVRHTAAESPLMSGWHWWQWVGAVLTLLLGGLSAVAGWSWWRNR